MKLIIIVGPTGSGKTELSYNLAKKYNFEIINADAFQVYKEINQGINKPNNKIIKEIKHHFVNSISVFDDWNIKLFKEQAELIIDNSNKPLIICGGSNLYIHALIHNYNLSNFSRTNKYDAFSSEELYNKLLILDEEEAKKIGKNNHKYLARALEIIDEKLILKSEIKNYNHEIKYEFFIIFINPNRKKLYEKINKRTELMFDKKIIDEILDLDLLRFQKTNASKAIGYKQIIENNLIIDENVIDKIKQNTRNYAKRQVTWIRNKFKIDFETEDWENDFNKITIEINKFLEEEN